MSEERDVQHVSDVLVRVLTVVIIIAVVLMILNALLIRAMFRMSGSITLSASGEAHVIPADYITVEATAPVRLKGYIRD